MPRTKPACTCPLLNRKLMALLLKVDEGSVHEQACVENAVAAERARIARAVRGLPEHGEWSERCGWVGAISKHTVLAIIGRP